MNVCILCLWFDLMGSLLLCFPPATQRKTQNSAESCRARSCRAERSFLERSCQTFCSFVECEVKQERNTAVSSQTQGEADEEQKKREREESERGGQGEWERSSLCDMHWCSCSSRSNAASVLCSSSSRLPSAPLNYSPPEDVQCGCLLFLLLLPVFFSCDGLFQRQRTEVSTYKPVNPPCLIPQPLI